MTLSFLDRPHDVLQGPADVGTEQRWLVRLADGRDALVGQLAPDLARDESIRRRYVRDQERVIQLGVHAVVETVALGPAPDPRDPAGDPPWRVRLAPDAESLSSILARAPLGLEEFTAIFSGLADAVHVIHQAGAVLRDLRPEQVLRTRSGTIVLCDIGLARVDVLSSHTASSLLLQGSPYAAPEQLFRTTVDQRSDLYSLGALMWHGLVGALPFDDGPALLRERPPLPDPTTLRADTPQELAELLPRLLEAEPEHRPPSASEITWVLRGGHALALADGTVNCQHCGASLRMGQRLCMACGRLAVRFTHVPLGERGWGLDLLSLSEDARRLEWLQRFLADVSRHPMRAPEFIIGNVHLYDEDEKVGRLRLPARLYSDLDEETATSLHETMREQGLAVQLVRPDASRRAALELLGAGLAAPAIVVALSTFTPAAVWGTVTGLFVVGFIALLARFNNITADKRTPGAFRLRDAPVALPASDPYVARLAGLLDPAPPADVRAIVTDLALLVQRLVDHRATLHGGGTAELDVVTAPIEPLVDAVERAAGQLIAFSEELDSLDEGAMVRSLAAAEAREDPAHVREPILRGLDQLRALEDQRAAVLHRLLELQTLLHRTVSLGLSVQNPAAQHERDMQRALASLEHAS
ncbi:MAG: protein kinase domain-containing protein [Nannocystaceae bacterium]|nr:protein kinase [bacterium]